jgi:diaminopimelate epimerase
MSTEIAFFKMSGSGNDFILIDNRAATVPRDLGSELARSICRRKVSVGADGLILIETDKEVDFSWRFFNADGSSAEMCGNGGRCAARLACLLGICGPRLSFRTLAGIVQAEVMGSRVKLQITSPHDLRLDEALDLDGLADPLHSVNTGVPHAVFLMDRTENLETRDIVNLGRKVRFHPRFAPAGTNVNFVVVLGPQSLAIRTYERGVEDETLACGTGAVAAALVAAAKQLVKPPVSVQTRSGEILTIHFNAENDLASLVFLEGETTVIYRGKLWREAFKDLALQA